MALIKNGEIVEDTWTYVSDEAEAPANGDIIVSLDRWRSDESGLSARPGRVGLLLRAGESPSEVAGDLSRFDVIAIEFPAFKDGRGYSYARLLRERYGYRGEVRAIGDVLRDQVFFMARCGFDAFDVGETIDAAAIGDALREISVVYQPAADARRPVLALRHAQSSAA